MSQSNTRVGDIRVLANLSLLGMEGRLVKMVDGMGFPALNPIDDPADLALYLVIEGASNGQLASVRPIDPGRNIRVALLGACAPGDILVLAVPGQTGANAGKVMTFTGLATPGTYRAVAIAEEAGVDGQLVLCRPAMLGLLEVKAPAGGGGGN